MGKQDWSPSKIFLFQELRLKIHLKKAKEKGFIKDEIDEVAWMGISFAGSPAMVFYEQLKNS